VLHLGYLNAFFGRNWLNAVYWTLAIEFQYYVGVGLLYPLLAHRRRALRLAVMCLLVSAVFLVPNYQFIFLHLPHFFVGTALFQHRAGLTSGRECVLTIGALLVLAAFTMSLPGALAGLAAALCIRFARLRQRPLVFAGDISYSLYLLHLPVGGVVLHASRLHGVGWPFAVIAATAASVFAAWLMYLFVERPSRRLSSRIRYRRQADASAFPARAAEAPAA
ncbi:MAG TPA: acyltransferase family protein, partial [Pyrinomonadaceae bacterium]|nr:acyltransferase family protein [Pyrinomonadaceae bacterium]